MGVPSLPRPPKHCLPFSLLAWEHVQGPKQCSSFAAVVEQLLDHPHLHPSARSCGSSSSSALIFSIVSTPTNVLVLDDIFDTGNTLVELLALMDKLGPTSIRTAVLLRKLGQQEVDLQPDFVGFDIPNEFVVGYGLDYQDEFRNLPYVACLEPDDLRD